MGSAPVRAGGRAVTTPTLTARALPGLPEVRPGDDLAALIIRAARGRMEPGTVLVVAHKIVSKAEGALVELSSVVPGGRACALAAAHGKDARHVQVVLDQS